MRFSYFDTEVPSKKATKAAAKKLAPYQSEIETTLKKHKSTRPEYSLIHAAQGEFHTTLADLKKEFKGIKHLILIGIGGSSLGVEAVHTVLGQRKVKLSVLDTIAPYEIDILLKTVSKYKKSNQLAVCIVSKSGGTTETLVNASVLVKALQDQFGKSICKQCICIGDKGTKLMQYAKRNNMRQVVMPKAVGGRFSVATEVGLVPLTLLGHDVDSYIDGLLDANKSEIDTVALEGAISVYEYMKAGYRYYNFFAFDKRLAQLGAWYRQLFAESLGKSETIKKKKNTLGMVPSITTAVELHSVGQLYFSGFAGVFTEFVTFDDTEHEHKIPKTGLAASYGKYTNQEVATAMYAGVIQAYQDKKLPYRSVIFDEDNLEYSLGLFMALRMREVMYLAKLLDVHAFNQPNVELYKKKTKKILNIS